MFSSTQIAFFIFGSGSGSMPEAPAQAPAPVNGASITYGGRDQSGNETEFSYRARTFGSSEAWVVYGTRAAITATVSGYDSGTGTLFSDAVSGHPYNADLECQVIASNATGILVYYPPIRVKTVPQLNLTGMTAGTITADTIAVSFTPPATLPITGYRGYCRVNGTTGWLLGSVVGASSTEFVFTGLSASTTFDFAGAAYNFNGPVIGDAEMELSSVLVAQTIASPYFVSEDFEVAPTGWQTGADTGSAFDISSSSQIVHSGKSCKLSGYNGTAYAFVPAFTGKNEIHAFFAFRTSHSACVIFDLPGICTLKGQPNEGTAASVRLFMSGSSTVIGTTDDPLLLLDTTLYCWVSYIKGTGAGDASLSVIVSDTAAKPTATSGNSIVVNTNHVAQAVDFGFYKPLAASLFYADHLRLSEQPIGSNPF